MCIRDREKTAFSTPSGLFQFNVMPFGLCNALATFERLMDLVLWGLTWKTCLVYLDFIVIGKTFKDHLENLKVLTIIHSAQLKLSPKKCSLFQKEVQYLGYLVSAAGVSMDPNKVDTIRDWPVPKSKHKVRSFLGLCSYYRRFVKGFSTPSNDSCLIIYSEL